MRELLADEDLDLPKFFIDVVKGNEKGFKSAERIEAAKWLADRGYGKSPELVLRAELDANATEQVLDLLSAEELRWLARANDPAPVLEAEVSRTIDVLPEPLPETQNLSAVSGPDSETE